MIGSVDANEQTLVGESPSKEIPLQFNSIVGVSKCWLGLGFGLGLGLPGT